MPEDVVPRMIECDNDEPTTISSTGTINHITDTPKNWKEYVKAQSTGTKWIFNNIKCNNWDGIVESMVNGKLVCMSDGAFANNHATAAWVFSGAPNGDDTPKLWGKCVCPGGPHSQSAY